VILLSLLIVIVGCGEDPIIEEPVARPVKMLTLGGGDTVRPLEYPGAVEPAQNSEMAFEVAGKIIEFVVTEGERVDEGALLARLDLRDFENALDSARAERDRAKAFRDRIVQAAKTGAVSRQEVTDAQASYNQAEAEVSIRQKALEDASLRAPFSGRVAKRLAEDFANVRAKEAVLVLQDDSHLELKVSVPEADLVDAKPGRSLEDANARLSPAVVISAFPDRVFPGRIAEFSTTADPVTRTFEATLVFDNPTDVAVLPGMTAKAILSPRQEGPSGGFMLPASAVLADETGTASVWVVDPSSMKVRRAQVQVGELSGSDVEVRGGLRSGDVIAISGMHQLREGMEVRRFDN
jgi:RND family efflux transporter MFP subunit